ncbi:MAG: Uma2 family endonuclease [Cyanothece sp. SIO1E1]|nr:Uma2 family endonuclease [Cyanothece sp. SIO1E1]
MVQAPKRTVKPIQWSIQDYHRMIEAGILTNRQVELLNGEIIEMPPEGPIHSYFGRKFRQFLEKLLGDQVEVLQGQPVTLSDSEPEPDIAIVQPLAEEYLRHHPYAENIYWVIEVSNTSLGKDRNEKRKAYASAGIREYWLINLQQIQLEVYRHPQDGDYQNCQVWTAETIQPLAFPEVSIPVKQLLSVATRPIDQV